MTRLDRAEAAATFGTDLPVSRFFIAAAFLIASTTLGFVCRDLRAGWLAVVVAINFTMFVAFWKIVFGTRLSYIDPGIVLLSVVSIYSIIPLLTTEAMNFNFGALQDARLARITLDDGIISTTVANANGIMAGFGAAYLAIRKPRMSTLGTTTPHAMAALWLMFGLAALVQVGLALAGGGGGTYSDEYLLIQSLPVFVIQTLNVLSNLFYVALFGLMVHYFRARQLRTIAVLLLFSIALFALVTGARTPLVLILFAAIVCWDHLYRRISPVVIALLLVFVITTFLALGALRGGSQTISAAFAQSEFMAVFVTALDIRQIYLTGSSLDMGTTLLFGDLLRLVPQQILPFEKIDPASWYVTTFYPEYAAQGGGFAFGMLAESALSGGVPAAIARGFALGTILGFVLNLLTRRNSIWSYIIYVWLIISAYQCFRDTTFTLFGRFFFQFFPAILLCVALSFLLRRNDASLTHPAADGAQPTIG